MLSISLVETRSCRDGNDKSLIGTGVRRHYYDEIIIGFSRLGRPTITVLYNVLNQGSSNFSDCKPHCYTKSILRAILTLFFRNGTFFKSSIDNKVIKDHQISTAFYV